MLINFWPSNVLLSHLRTTLGAKELNFCVRYGNRCDLLAIITRLYLVPRAGIEPARVSPPAGF